MFEERNHKCRVPAFLALLATLFLFQSQSYALDVTLQWNANREPDLSGYRIYYKPDASGGQRLDSYTGEGAAEGASSVTVLLEQDENSDPNLVEFTLHNLDDGKTYFMVVTAMDTEGFESEASNEVGTHYSGPGKALILSASPPPATWSNDDTAAVTWAAPTGLPDGIEIEGYSTVWDRSSGTTPDAEKTHDAATSTRATVLPDGDSYYFHIRALDTVGNWGEAEHCGPFYIDTGPPWIDGIEMISESTLEITYGENDMRHAAVADNYALDHGAIVSDITDVSGVGRIFRLTLSNLQSEKIYTLVISENVTDAAGHPIPAEERIVGDINDFDRDGMPDIREIFWFGDMGLSDGSGDTDGDGITDGDEVSIYQTDPLNPDTDHDGLTDGQEILVGRDPALREIGRAGRVGDELVADFGSAYGLWHYEPLRGWAQLNTVSPDLMLAADLDGDGKEELVVSFKGYGLYIYRETRSWSLINSVTPEAMIRLGSGLVADFGSAYGLWHYEPLRGWAQLNTVSPDLMLAADVDSDGKEELVASFNGYGLYAYKESSGWLQINNIIPEAIIRLGNGLVADFGVAYGLWHYDQERGWRQLNPLNPEQMLAADLDSDGIDELIASFSVCGLCVYKEGNDWSVIGGAHPEDMMPFGHGLMANYGAESGLWHYDLEEGWRQLTTAGPDWMLALDMDKDGREELLSSFGADGLHVYRGGTEWFLLHSVVPVSAISINMLD